MKQGVTELVDMDETSIYTTVIMLNDKILALIDSYIKKCQRVYWSCGLGLQIDLNVRAYFTKRPQKRTLRLNNCLMLIVFIRLWRICVLMYLSLIHIFDNFSFKRKHTL